MTFEEGSFSAVCLILFEHTDVHFFHGRTKILVDERALNRLAHVILEPHKNGRGHCFKTEYALYVYLLIASSQMVIFT